MKQRSVAFEKIILEDTRDKSVENVVLKSGVDFNCIFSAMVKNYIGNYVTRRTHGLAVTISTMPRNSKCPTSGALQDG